MIDLPSIIRVQDLAKKLELPVGNILATLLKNGVLATLNDDLDYDTAAIIAQDLGYKTTESVEELEKDVLTVEKLNEILKKEDPAKQTPRPPIVTIMGHVDHGKTTLLDTIRSANVASGEAGGITQAISSYQTEYNGRTITFIDTPGHETFDFMRQRGAALADLVVLVVAADDGVQPQTKDAVAYAKKEGLPIVVAINKIDRAEANIDRVKKELGDLDLIPEEWGGETVMLGISALKKQGINELLEIILLTSDIHQPKADPTRAALGTVIESKLDKSVGPIASVIIHTGTLQLGDDVVIGKTTGKVRQMRDFRGKQIKKATPSVPVMIIGLKDVPQAGDILQAVEAQGEAVSKAAQRRAPLKKMSKTDDNDQRQTLAIVLKADSKGSLEALEQTITAMVPQEVRLSVVRADVGAISDSDVLTARAGNAIIYGFNIPIAGMSQKLADKEKISVRLFAIIYQLAEDVRNEIEQRMPVDIVTEDIGRVKILKVFFSTAKRKIVGGEVAEGIVEPNAKIIIKRKDKLKKDAPAEHIGTGVIVELQKDKRPLQKAEIGDQVGMTIEGRDKMKEGDVLEIYRETRVRKGSVPQK
ncbi:MAG: translation initiation factor IF-2 [Candidatus Andersenbacteria bacterium RIFCSPHIGHO2_12_FULL_45_11b]|uniref:Translation initiation factor IF-2 n=1 Tax=Candidatus Andersenbacteria bacterium RIFCSPHIGHO2_12_FULL_45_11b TaxID=1797282 RepID=A0A1G1X7V7_9BACT|nr:MAG: translation initiation factor IF-2 [Candidatus Andersenbacteria bacterium RIFCSPHIGHO2_12_FULL_45_11b]